MGYKNDWRQTGEAKKEEKEMTTKKPYIQIRIVAKDKWDWVLAAGNGIIIAYSYNRWDKAKPCRRSAHRAGISLHLEVRNEK